MKITVRQAIVAADAIASIRNKSLPVRVSYALNKSFAALSRERNAADEERIKLCKKYADKDEAGEPIVTENAFKMTEENEKACNAEFREFWKQKRKWICLNSRSLIWRRWKQTAGMTP